MSHQGIGYCLQPMLVCVYCCYCQLDRRTLAIMYCRALLKATRHVMASRWRSHNVSSFAGFLDLVC